MNKYRYRVDLRSSKVFFIEAEYALDAIAAAKDKACIDRIHPDDWFCVDFEIVGESIDE